MLGVRTGIVGADTAGEESNDDKSSRDPTGAGVGRLVPEGGDIGLKRLDDIGGGGMSPIPIGDDVDAVREPPPFAGLRGRSSSSRTFKLEEGLIVSFRGGGGGGNASGSGDGGAGHWPARAAALSTRLSVAR